MPPASEAAPGSRDPPISRRSNRWKALERQSHREDVREEIRRALRAGLIRVQPSAHDPERVRITPVSSDGQHRLDER
jgi:hypothetical protein